MNEVGVFDGMLTSIRQTRTPLNTLYFSRFNLNLIQKAIRSEFRKHTGKAIDYQNENDVLALMRQVFIMNMQDPYKAVNCQVRQMNGVVIKTALGQISTGVSQYFDYATDVASPLQPMSNPINTTTFGNKISTTPPIGI